MPNLERMTAPALSAMINVLDLTPEDRVLVIGDTSAGACPRAFAEAAQNHGCRVDTFLLPENNRPLQSLPNGMIDLLDQCTVVINAISGLSDEVPFRLKWIKEIEARDLRMGHSPGINEGMMMGGPLDVDYADMRNRAQHLTTALAGADSIHITSDLGSDLTLGVTGRHFVNDVHITATEKGGNLPCGEVYCCPVEDQADGVLVVDGCFGGDGNVTTPLTIQCEGGRVVDVRSDDPTQTSRVNELMDTDEGSRTVCELGIGLNPGARLVGNMLEDEKALRTLHVAFGGNQGMPGGQNVSSMHVDYLVHRPHLTAIFPDSTRKEVLRNGDLVG